MGHITLMDELVTLSQDLGFLAELRREGASRNPAVLRMCAAKAEHAGQILRALADGLDAGTVEIA
jgi:hypothetical protein